LRVLIGLFPELDAPGGVQRAGRHLAAVLTEFAASRGMDCRLLTLNDSPELHRMTLGGREFVFAGSARAKGQFTSAAMQAARRPPPGSRADGICREPWDGVPPAQLE